MLSSSLGHILMQLHSGTLYLIKHEACSRLLALSFKILMLLIASTPYSRMPAELLSRVISSVQSTIEEGFSFHNDRSSLLAAAIICLTRALSVSSSMCVNNMLLGEISTGCLDGQRSGVLHTLFRYSEQLSTPSICLEAHQALKALSHNYPNVMALCWEQISSIIYGVLSSSPDEPARLWRGNVEQTVAPIKERVMTAAVKVKANAVRGQGNLARSIQFTKQLPVHGDPLDSMNSKLEYPDTQGSKAHMKERSHLFPTSSGDSDWLEQMVQATGNVKVQWNVCHALSNLFLNKSLKLQDMDWVSSVFSILLLLLRDSSNFKIRIQAAAALAVPETIKDYGKSYYDVKSVVHVVESFKSDQISEPSNFKYWIALEKQFTSTMLHLLGLASRCDQRAMQDLLVKKASFLEVWIEGLCSSLGDTSNSLDEAKHVSVDQKKDVIFRTIRSLIEVYKSSNHDVIAQRFDKLDSSLL